MIITGYAESDAIGERPDDVAILAKPFSLEQLGAHDRSGRAKRIRHCGSGIASRLAIRLYGTYIEWHWRITCTACSLAWSRCSSSPPPARPPPPPNVSSRPRLDPPAQAQQTAVLAGGCFWGLEAVFERLQGVDNVVSGYAGGSPQGRHLRARQHRKHEHAEAVRITYDPKRHQLRHAAARLFLGRARSDPAQPPGPGRRPAIARRYSRRMRRKSASPGPISTSCRRRMPSRGRS